MAKLRTVFKCRECGAASTKWLGQCPECGKWNTLEEEVEEVAAEPKARRGLTGFSSEVVPLSKSDATEAVHEPTGISELDRLLGGGIVRGQMILLAGHPGIGKSTLMLQIASNLARGKKILYVTGEESIGQVAARAKRLGVRAEADISLLAETNLEKIIAAYRKVGPDVLVIDSIQTVSHPEFTGSCGTIGQVRESAAELLRLCKPEGTALFVLGHVTKDGDLAGPKVLEHIVDTVLYFDSERHNLLRVLRAHKNRFGPTSELGIFRMAEGGLEPVEDANACFTSGSKSRPLKGRAFSMALEGNRPLLSEVQALVAPTRYPFPRRMATGLDSNRFQILLAAIERHAGVSLENRDVYASLAGGLKLADPALDMALCAAVISSARDIIIPPDWVFIGEAGILGQSARVSGMELRLAEAYRMGYRRAFTPTLSKEDRPKGCPIEITEIEEIGDIVSHIPKAAA